ncbi:hypothetical protein [Terriglobus roseus]|uniref:hypothetical protein n=1 Tax=Terriglobus roseus TaxID=392734 RepID=UPI0009F550EC|nr:hypothetical protein [Terriglobus roseus]
MTLYAKRLNHGRSEIWLDDGPHRDTATNNVNFAVKKYAAEKFEAFYSTLHENMGTVATVEANAELVADLGL